MLLIVAWPSLAMFLLKEENLVRSKVSRRKLLQSTGAAFLLTQAEILAEASEPNNTAAESPSFASIVKRRAMIRAYKNDPVPEELIQRLLEYAVRAPSAGNLQPWEFIIIQDPEVRAQLATAAFEQTSVATAPVIIAKCADIQRMGEKYGTRGSFYSLVDTSFASLLILLGVVEQGLGACFVGAYDPVEVAKILGLPEHVRPVGLITIGYPAEPPRKPHNKKIRLQKLVHRDKWDRTYA